MNCYHCGAQVDNGLALCALCQTKVRKDLEYLPIYFRNLTRWKPGRAGSRPVPGSRIPAGVLPAGEDKVELLVDETEAGMIGWARFLAKDRPGHLERVAWRILGMEGPQRYRLLCEMFDRHLTSVATLGWCGDFVEAVSLAEQELRRTGERVAPGWYAGACQHCGTDTHVMPGVTWVSCQTCGAYSAARDHLPVLLTEARGWVATPKRLAEALVALLDSEMSVPRLHERIRKWSLREKVSTVRRLDRDGDEIGPKRHRLGEVLDLLMSEGQTRTGAKAYRKSA